MIATCISIGTTSLSARPTSSAGRPSGETSWRSCEPDCISSIRLAPVNDAPISAVMATMPGTNHCSAEPSAISGSSGAKRPRKTSGWIIAKTTAIGSRHTGLSSRFITFQVSATKVLMLRPRSRSRVRGVSVLRMLGLGGGGFGGGLAQAATGEVEEDVVEGGPRDLHPRRGYAVRGQVGEQLTDHRGAVHDPQVERGAVDLDAGVGHPLQPGGGPGGVAGRAEAEPDQVAEPALEPGGGVVGDHPAVVDDDDATGEGVGLLEVVGGEHDGAAALGVQPADQLLEVGAVLRVEAGRGLVEEEHPRQVDQPHRDVEPAALAAGEGGDLAVGDRGEVEVLDQLGGPAPRVGAGQAVGAALADQLVAAELAVPGTVALPDEADRPAYVALGGDDVVAGDARRARGGRRSGW